ncbi:amidase [Mycolicibacterium sp. P1-18]|nr:amidase [Mycolicibacterium sp. P1-18]
MRSAARQCERVRDDIHDNGVAPLNDHWSDHVGALASDALKSVASRAGVVAILARSSVDPIDTLNHAVSIAQNELENGVQIAESAGFRVDPITGSISPPPGMPVEEMNSKMASVASAQQMISDAVEAATQADGLCASALRDTNAFAETGDIDAAQRVQADNAQKALEEIRDTLPDGLTPDQVAKWWGHLTASEQFDLERACPAELFNTSGIPDAAKAAIDRPELGYSSAGTVQYAIDNWNNPRLDAFKDNCTNFVSDSLSYGGNLKQREDWFLPRHFDTDGWSDGTGGNRDGLPPGLSHTPSWAAAQNNRDFFLHNGGSVVDKPEQVRPGDVVYYTMTQDSPAAGLAAGETHHAAVVTGVLPDGQVLYTQHSGDGKNFPLYGRLPQFEQSYGQQKIEIVQPRRTW